MRPAEPAPAIEDQDPPPAPPAVSTGRRALVAGAGGVAAALVLILLALTFRVLTAPVPPTPGDVDRAVATQLDQEHRKEAMAPAEASTAYATIGPSLVTVTSEQPSQQEALGTGVVVNATGAILTALHVVDGASRVQVTFADGTTAAARVVVRRPAQDIAVLYAERNPGVLVPAVLAGAPAVGEAVFAVGNPLGLRGSLSSGVVSGLDRNLSTPTGGRLEGLIQFDAAVNPGNSGGPLLNRAGQVVGIVTGLANPSGQYFSGIGFAVPISSAGGAAGGPQQ